MLAPSLLRRLSQDSRLPAGSRKFLADSAALSEALRGGRRIPAASSRKVRIWDCEGTDTLPGHRVDIATSTDPCVQRVNDTSTSLLAFLSSVFGRNSIDNRGCPVDSSIHYSRGLCNASWSDGRMVFGDGDGYLFTDFTRSIDFIGHEIVHGVTEHESGLGYEDEYGALNESASDVLGSVFRQWARGETADQASWQIGADLITPQGQALGWQCIRDLANPGSTHSISPQASNYAQYVPHGDVHFNSGIPNFAFHAAAKAVGGKTWECTGLVWYRALCSPAVGPHCTFAEFARATLDEARRSFPASKDLPAVLRQAWGSAGVPV